MKLIRSPIMSGMGEAMLLAAPALRRSDTTIGPVLIAAGQNGPAL